VSGEWRRGVQKKDSLQRLVYLDDGLPQFVRKEDMNERLPYLLSSLQQALLDTPVDLIISHYWDGAKLGVLYNRTLADPVPHIWIPHSLGAIKKRNMPPERWDDLRIDERIDIERELVTQVDRIGTTSSLIQESLTADYGYHGLTSFLPPCVDPQRYRPREISKTNDVWDYLGRLAGLRPEEVQKRTIISEISRTDRTKRKDLLLRAFASVHEHVPDSFLVVAIDEKREGLAADLRKMIDELGLRGSVAPVGSIWELLPTIYGVTDIYCTPSEMEGFGMSAQEAAATAVPVVASNLVPFVSEYLLGSKVESIAASNEHSPMQIGEGGIVVEASNEDGFVEALRLLVSNTEMRRQMGQAAYQATVPYFTWQNLIPRFLDQINLAQPKQNDLMG
jgi:glycosyltransferase involved in cell wall biosynthesis